jgi:hypothetical protein
MLFHWRIIPIQGNGKITGEDENDPENQRNQENPKNPRNPRNQGK